LYSDSEFKYPTPIRFYDKNGRRMVYNYNSSLPQNIRSNTRVYTAETPGQSKFFIDYRSHSIQLADALREWFDQVKFTSYRYEQGSLDIDNQEPVESMNKGFMRYMKEHMKKEEAYQQQILALIVEIETTHKQLCERIKDVISSEIPYKPSFQKIIIDKIKSCCPMLKKTRRSDLEENNIYIESNIFKLIFGKIFNKEPTIILKIVPSFHFSNSDVLMHRELLALAQGESSDMDRLKTAIEQLVMDNDIKKKVDEYTDYEKQLTNYERINELKDRIDDLWTFIQGGGYLGGFDACELCDPSKLAPI
jgi:hypothetical protein